MRPECGPMQFGDDWPGTFVRGDRSAYYAMLLRALLDGNADQMSRKQLEGLVAMLEACNVASGRDPRKLRPFAECVLPEEQHHAS